MSVCVVLDIQPLAFGSNWVLETFEIKPLQTYRMYKYYTIDDTVLYTIQYYSIYYTIQYYTLYSTIQYTIQYYTLYSTIQYYIYIYI